MLRIFTIDLLQHISKLELRFLEIAFWIVFEDNASNHEKEYFMEICYICKLVKDLSDGKSRDKELFNKRMNLLETVLKYLHLRYLGGSVC